MMTHALPVCNLVFVLVEAVQPVSLAGVGYCGLALTGCYRT